MSLAWCPPVLSGHYCSSDFLELVGGDSWALTVKSQNSTVFQQPVSIQCLEDKIAQQAIVTVLNQIYETDFQGFSYGFRPKRSQHDALDALTCGIVKRKVNWVLDLDIRKFFDTIEHEWLNRMLKHRIQDKRLLKLITRWIKVGIVDGDGKRCTASICVPQGAVISPLLSDIYLHYVFDLWSQ